MKRYSITISSKSYRKKPKCWLMMNNAVRRVRLYSGLAILAVGVICATVPVVVGLAGLWIAGAWGPFEDDL
jgi:hypothetical protein